LGAKQEESMHDAFHSAQMNFVQKILQIRYDNLV